MIVVHESAPAFGTGKPVLCPKCKKGRIGSIPGWSKAKTSKRGSPPPNERGEYIYVRCSVCGSFALLTIE